MSHLTMPVNISQIFDPAYHAEIEKHLPVREHIMLMALALLCQAPEGTGLTYENVRNWYDWFRVTGEVCMRNESAHPRRDPLTELNNMNCRLRSNLMLLEALPPSEGEDKGELFRLYDQARRSLHEGVWRELGHIFKD